jgi:methyl-accepting chemotaxis protein
MVWHKFVGKLSGRIAAVIGKLKQSARQLDTAADAIGERSGSVAASASELMRATQSQAAASEETSVATGSVTETAKVNYQTAESMRTLSAGTETILKQAVATLGDVDSAMQSISSTSGNVLGIADSINEISFATNIVSLNASIEAARAGEAGVTFAYIAGEVRSLAKKCAGAADETKKIVSQSRTEMERGSQLVGRLVNALHPIGKSSDQIRDLATEVSATSKQQAESLRQVLEAVEQIQRASESSAQAARKGADDAEELQSQVTSLVRSVSEIEQAIEILNNEFALSGKAAS